MMRWIAFTASVLTVLLVCCAGTGADSATVGQWNLHEITLESSKSYTNPFEDVDVFADFVGPDSQVIRVYGFYDGDGMGGQGDLWKIRFIPPELGSWTWETVCTRTNNTGLHGQTGSFTVAESVSPGPVAPSPGRPRAWQHANGRWGLWNLGYSLFMAGADRSHPSVGGWQDYLDWLEAHRFGGVLFLLQPTGIRTCSQCWDGAAPWAQIGANDPPTWAVERSAKVDYFVSPWAKDGAVDEFATGPDDVDYARFYLPFWANVDAILSEMQRKQMIAQVMLYNDESFHPIEGSSDEWRYLDYVIRRLGGFWNVVYNDGIDLFEYRSQGWVGEWQTYFENKDPFGKARSSRHGDDSSEESTWRSVQAAKDNMTSNISGWRNLLASQPAKPTTEEDGILSERDDGLPPELFRKLAWWSLLSGPGAFGNTWGGSHGPGNWFSNLDSGDEGMLHVERRTRFVLDFDPEAGRVVPFWKLEVHDELVTGTNVYCGAEPGKHYLVYFDVGAPQDSTVNLAATTVSLPATWLNLNTGERVSAGTTTPGSSPKFTAPFARPAVLYIGKGEKDGSQGSSPVFADGFEPGDTSSWTLVVE